MRRIIFSICIFALALSLSIFASAATISTADELLTLMNTSSMWADDYTLANNINLAEATNGLLQAPIGNETTPYSGTFDGNGYTISGIDINSTVNGVGLFGYAGNATIKNLTVEGKVTNTAGATAGIVGYVKALPITVENCVR